MRVSREQAEKNREQILNIAARRFRESGFDGASVAEVMNEAGLTHGGFYGHFNSKEDLAAQACAQAMEEKVQKWTDFFERGGKNPICKMAREYLNEERRDDPGAGCPLAAMAVDVSRQSPAVRRAFTDGLKSLVEIFETAAPGRTKMAKHANALAAWSTLVGAMVLARAVDDQRLSSEILKAAANAVANRE